MVLAVILMAGFASTASWSDVKLIDEDSTGLDRGLDNALTLTRLALENNRRADDGGKLSFKETNMVLSIFSCRYSGTQTVGECMNQKGQSFGLHPSLLASPETLVSTPTTTPEDGGGSDMPYDSRPSEFSSLSLLSFSYQGTTGSCSEPVGFRWSGDWSAEEDLDEKTWYYCQKDSDTSTWHLWKADSACDDARGEEAGTCKDVPPPHWETMEVYNPDEGNGDLLVNLTFNKGIDQVSASDFSMGERFEVRSAEVSSDNSKHVHLTAIPGKVEANIEGEIKSVGGDSRQTGSCSDIYKDVTASNCPSEASPDWETLFTRYSTEKLYYLAILGFSEEIDGASVSSSDFGFSDGYNTVDGPTSVSGDQVYVYFQAGDVPVEIQDEITSIDGGSTSSGQCSDLFHVDRGETTDCPDS